MNNCEDFYSNLVPYFEHGILEEFIAIEATKEVRCWLWEISDARQRVRGGKLEIPCVLSCSIVSIFDEVRPFSKSLCDDAPPHTNLRN